MFLPTKKLSIFACLVTTLITEEVQNLHIHVLRIFAWCDNFHVIYMHRIEILQGVTIIMRGWAAERIVGARGKYKK